MPYKNKQDLYDYQKRRWKERKIKAILDKGGKCNNCGIKYNGENGGIFDFHHLNPETKEYGWKRLKLRSDSDIKKELEKQICLCSNCHRLEHSEKF